MQDDIATAHADLRLMQRIHEMDRTMTELWDTGIPCEVKYKHYDEARIVPEESMVMLMIDGKIVTVLDDMQDVTVDDDDVASYIDGVIGERLKY